MTTCGFSCWWKGWMYQDGVDCCSGVWIVWDMGMGMGCHYGCQPSHCHALLWWILTITPLINTSLCFWLMMNKWCSDIAHDEGSACGYIIHQVLLWLCVVLAGWWGHACILHWFTSTSQQFNIASDVLEVSIQQVFHLSVHIRLTGLSCCIDEHGRVGVFFV